MLDERCERERRRREVRWIVAPVPEPLAVAFPIGERSLPVAQLVSRGGSPRDAVKLEVDRLILHRADAQVGEPERLLVVAELVVQPCACGVDVPTSPTSFSCGISAMRRSET